MKKTKFLCFLMLILSVVLLPTAVLASENIVNVDSKDTLTACISVTGNTCKLTADIVLNKRIAINDGMDVTIDLNGYSITQNSTLRINGGLIMVHSGGKLVVNDTVGTGKIGDGSLENVWAPIQVGSKKDGLKVATLVVNGGTLEGYWYAITGNGLYPNTDITINNGTLKGMEENESLGIYHPQTGKLTINNGTITGGSGVEIRSGSLVVNGGTITGTAKVLKTAPNGSGSTTEGAGVAVVQHTNGLDLSAEINGGVLKGVVPFYEENVNDFGTDSTAKVKLSVKGGQFSIINDGSNAVYSEEKTGFVTGGIFSKDIDHSYLGTDVITKLLGTTYTAGKENSITVSTVTNGTVTVDKTKAVVGEKVKLNIVAVKDFEIASVKVLDASNNEITITNNEFIMPNSEGTIKVIFTKTAVTAELPVLDPSTDVEKVTIGVKEADKNDDVLVESLKKDESLTDALETSSLKVEIEVEEVKEEDIDEKVIKNMKEKAGKATLATYFDITLAVKNTNDTKVGELSELTDKIELMILLPENLRNVDKTISRAYFVLRSHGDKTELIEAKLSKDGKYLLFESDRFSTYALAYEDTTNPQTIDNIGYYGMLFGLAMFSLFGCTLYLKKKQTNM